MYNAEKECSMFVWNLGRCACWLVYNDLSCGFDVFFMQIWKKNSNGEFVSFFLCTFAF